jgi:hypothetical protein
MSSSETTYRKCGEIILEAISMKKKRQLLPGLKPQKITYDTYREYTPEKFEPIEKRSLWGKYSIHRYL